MAFPSLPAFELLQGQTAVLKKGSVIIGQAMSVSPQAQTNTNKHSRIGDFRQKTSYSASNNTVQVQFYAEHDPAQLGAFLGVDKPGTGGWVGTEELRLNTTLPGYDLTIEIYDENSGDAVLEGIWTLENFKPNQMGFNVEADNVTMFNLSGDVDDIYLIPEAGLGA